MFTIFKKKPKFSTTPIKSVGRDNPSEKQPEPNPITGQRQPQKMPQTEPQEIEKEKDFDVGGGD